MRTEEGAKRNLGRFIVLEGIDGAGTTTQANLVAERLRARGLAVHVTAEPSSGSVGRHIRALLGSFDTNRALLALLFAADRLEHWYREIAPALAAGTWVLCDRYLWSSLAYQSQDLPEEWVASINRHAPKPDLVVLVDVPVALASQRRSGRTEKEIFDDEPVQEAIRAKYHNLLAQAGESAVAVDGTGPVAEVCDQVLAALAPLMTAGEGS